MKRRECSKALKHEKIEDRNSTCLREFNTEPFSIKSRKLKAQVSFELIKLYW